MGTVTSGSRHDNDPLRSALRADLVVAMKARQVEAVAALRSTIAAIDNAGAVPVGGDPTDATSHHVAGATVGLASTEAERRVLPDDELQAIVRSQIAERVHAAAALEAHGRGEAADRLRREADVLRRYV